MKDLTKERIKEIVENSDDMYMALLNFYKEAISPVSWDEIATIAPCCDYILSIIDGNGNILFDGTTN